MGITTFMIVNNFATYGATTDFTAGIAPTGSPRITITCPQVRGKVEIICVR